MDVLKQNKDASSQHALYKAAKNFTVFWGK